jgi:hypothetical protein
LFFKHLLLLLPGAMGAVVALKFLGEGLCWWQKLSNFLAGLSCAVYVAPVVVDWLDIINVRFVAGIEFLVGLFGLAIAREIFSEINDADILDAIKRKYLGAKIAQAPKGMEA